MKVIKCLNDIASQIISWPRGEELNRVKADFNKNSLQGIIGAIDGTHILIKAPKVCYYVIKFVTYLHYNRIYIVTVM